MSNSPPCVRYNILPCGVRCVWIGREPVCADRAILLPTSTRSTSHPPTLLEPGCRPGVPRARHFPARPDPPGTARPRLCTSNLVDAACRLGEESQQNANITTSAVPLYLGLRGGDVRRGRTGDPERGVVGRGAPVCCRRGDRGRHCRSTASPRHLVCTWCGHNSQLRFFVAGNFDFSPQSPRYRPVSTSRRNNSKNKKRGTG